MASHEWLGGLCQLTTWLPRCTTNCFVYLSSFLYLYYKSPHYSRNCKETFREKTLEIHLRVRDYLPTILYKFLLVFLILLLSNSISFERFLAQTQTSPILSVVSCFWVLRKHLWWIFLSCHANLWWMQLIYIYIYIYIKAKTSCRRVWDSAMWRSLWRVYSHVSSLHVF